ncbi:MAG TPA: XdhC/CoxI family protein [Candidatus Polarisedimenticolaceae bacterium]|nr:XdhC/CoxI family protein [Candidatus Polarisedimenticolaceae bacterium]
MLPVLAELLDEVKRGRRCVLATIVRASGSTPRGPGARMLVRADGTTSGTIGGGAFEAMIGADARELLGGSEKPPQLRTYTFTETGENALGMACGGTAEVLLEVLGPGARLVVFGAGHVGLALATLAARVGFAPEIVDDREPMCEAARAAGVGRVFRCDARYEAGVPDLDPGCFVAVVTRCHATDRLALKHVVGRPLRYVGLIGSRRKKAVIFRELLQQDGIAEEALAAVRCPIGLPIGGETPEEIAVSIVAELLQVRGAA